MTRSLHTLIHYLRHRIPHGGDAALSDAQLLERWVTQQDPAAFELMLWRHGPMVLNACRRLLPRREDVEDAFQATFLVLVRKAGSIRRGEGLAPWLHRVACRIACRARITTSRRASREQLLAEMPADSHVETHAERELSSILDQEIDSLPAHYRRALILCCLEGKTQEEAARLLNCPRGTVSSWLTRGRERLRQRLLRRGIVVSTAGLTAALTPDALSSGGMIPLIDSLIRLAGAATGGGLVPSGLMSARTIALAEGVLRMMFMTKMKIVATICLLVGVAAAGVGAWSSESPAAEDPTGPQRVTEGRQPSEQNAFVTLSNELNAEWEHGLKMNGQDNIAWGEPVHGLQAGIAFRRGDQETYEIGQSVTFVVYLRNVSDKKISLSHSETIFEEWMPAVVDAGGRRLAVAHESIKLGVVPIAHRSLEAGQRIILGYPWFRIRPLGWRDEVLGPTCCVEPSRYKVGYLALPLRLSDGKDLSLGTRQVELSIRKGATAAIERFFAGGRRITRGWPPQYYFSTPTIDLPISVGPKNKDAAEFVLFVTADEGKSFQQVSRMPASAKRLQFQAPGDGTYWFFVMQVDKQGRCLPANLSQVMETSGVCVDTTPPVVTLQAEHARSQIQLTWIAKDTNLPDKAVQKLEWSNQREGPWSDPILSGPLANVGRFDWPLPDRMPSDFYVRIHVRDTAGNDGYAVAYVKLKKDE